MALIFDHQSINRPVGSDIFGPGNIPDGISAVTLRLARQTTATPTFWGSGVTVTVMIQDSTDGGVTFRDVCGFTASGGITFNKDGVTEAIESRAGGTLHSGTNRKAQIAYTVSGSNLVSLITLEVN